MSNVVLLDSTSAQTIIEGIATALGKMVVMTDFPTIWLNDNHDAGLQINASKSFFLLLPAKNGSMQLTGITFPGGPLYLTSDISPSGKTFMMRLGTTTGYTTTNEPFVVSQIGEKLVIFGGTKNANEEIGVYPSELNGKAVKYPTGASNNSSDIFFQLPSACIGQTCDEVYGIMAAKNIQPGQLWNINGKQVRIGYTTIAIEVGE